MAAALAPLLGDTAERVRQVAAFAKLDAIMDIGTARPSDRAADIVLKTIER
jgi:lipid-A-disaccharide synthase